jgi:hypothetical protein
MGSLYGKKEEEKEWERVVALKATKEKEKERERFSFVKICRLNGYVT